MTTPATPRVSVLLPCRDAAPWLPDCIASLGAQTEGSFEVLTLDDGSVDGTRGLLEAWAERDPRVRLLTAAGSGIVAALNRLAAAARAPVLARMDADDVARPERFARQLALLRARPAVVACGTGVRYVPPGEAGSGTRRYEAWLNALHEPGELARDLFVECPIAHPTLMVRRVAFEAVGGYRDRGWPEDYDLVLRLAGASGQLANVAEVLLDWRLHPRRLSGRDRRYAPDAFRRLKIHALRRGPVPGDRPLVVWGAGKVGKAFARAWQAEGALPRIVAFVDLDLRKIGQTIHDAPVIDPETLEARFRGAAGRPERRPFVLAAVGSPGARGEIRGALEAMGARELEDFRAVA